MTCTVATLPHGVSSGPTPARSSVEQSLYRFPVVMWCPCIVCHLRHIDAGGMLRHVLCYLYVCTSMS